jgi:hypothetical protein
MQETLLRSVTYSPTMQFVLEDEKSSRNPMTSLSFPYCVNLNVQNAKQSCFLGITLKKKERMPSVWPAQI